MVEFELEETRLRYRVVVEAVDSGKQRPATREDLIAALGTSPAEDEAEDNARALEEISDAMMVDRSAVETIGAIACILDELTMLPAPYVPDAEPTQPGEAPTLGMNELMISEARGL